MSAETVTAFPVDDGELDVEEDCDDEGLPDPPLDDTTIEEDSGPLTQGQKDVLLKIHETVGHPARDEFLRALRLSNARPKVLNYIQKSFRCPV